MMRAISSNLGVTLTLGVRTSVMNLPGWQTCRSRTAAVNISVSPGDWWFSSMRRWGGFTKRIPEHSARPGGQLMVRALKVVTDRREAGS
jgi:hypothetical protein